MQAYTDFANVYDLFMDNVPYEEWADRITELIDKYGEITVPEGDSALASEAQLMVDLGCGTGTLTRLLKKRGFDMIGVDLSYEMLEVARQKSFDSSDILYLNQDMRELELYSTVGNVISVCDSINYLLTAEDLLETFRLVNNYLYPRGLFIFDFNTVHKYRDVIGETTIAENREEGSFIWENYYYEDEEINEYDLTIYFKNSDETYTRSQETHIQRGYDLNTMTELVNKSGLQLVCAFDSDTNGEITENTERICMVAREVAKQMGD